MGLSCGIVGLPNVGKSTLFNALLAAEAANVQNYPFCTIEPNRGRIAVPSDAFTKLVSCIEPDKSIPNFIEIVDIAGLVRGASRGEGLGNKFLSHIREVDALLHLVRCFSSSRVLHVEEQPDALRDAELLETELLLSDLARLEPIFEQHKKRARGGASSELKREQALLERLSISLNDGKPARSLLADGLIDEEDFKFFKSLCLLSAKPMLYVCNVGEGGADEASFVKAMEAKASQDGASLICMSALVEAELVGMTREDRQSLLANPDQASGLERAAKILFELLDLLTFFTAGKQEVRAWTLRKGESAYDAAGKIHSDFQQGFIRAETLDYTTLLEYKSFEAAREAGKVRQEGRDYIVAENEVLLFRFNV